MAKKFSCSNCLNDCFFILRDEEPLDGDGIVVAAEETLALDDFKTCPEEFKVEMLYVKSLVSKIQWNI